MRIIILIVSILLSSVVAIAQDDDNNRELDSLIAVYDSMDKSDTACVEVCHKIAQMHYNVDSTDMWSQRLIDLAERHNMPSYKCWGLGYLCWALFYKDDYAQSTKLGYQAILLADSIGDKKAKAYNMRMVASNYYYMKDYESSDNYYHQTYDLYAELKDTSNMAYLLRLMCTNYRDNRMYELANETYEKSIQLTILSHDTVCLCENYIAWAEEMLEQYNMFICKDSIQLVSQAKENLLIARQYDNVDPIYSIIRDVNLSNCLFNELYYYNYSGKRKKDVLDSLQTLLTSIKKQVDDVDADDFSDLYIITEACYNSACGQTNKAKITLDSMFSAKSLEDEVFVDLLIAMRQYYNSIGDYKSAQKYINLYYYKILKHNKADFAAKAAQSIAESEYNDQLRQREKDEERRRMYSLFAIAAVALVAVFALMFYINSRRHNKELRSKNVTLLQQKEEILSQKEEIQAQNDEILEQNTQISNQNKQITASINYASLIQQAALPKDELMRELFGEFLVIYRPLHIVAGDFYWASKVEKYSILVCADCTGHGVPGAFVSMLGVSLLNECCQKVVLNGGNAADILNMMRDKLMKALNQDKELYMKGQRTNTDGMDLAMVMIDYGSMTLQYAGANRPLCIWRDGEITQYKPDKMPIGIYLSIDRMFTNHTISIQKNDALYMFSDGIPDQFGCNSDGETKHFSTKRLIKTLAESGAENMEKQKAILENTVDQWKGNQEQLDDNILIGIRI